MPWRGVARVVLIAEIQVQIAERDPGSLPAPACLDEARLKREHRVESRAGLGRALDLEPRLELKTGDRYPHSGHVAILTVRRGENMDTTTLNAGAVRLSPLALKCVQGTSIRPLVAATMTRGRD